MMNESLANYKELPELSTEDIKLISSVDLSPFYEFRVQPDELPYKLVSDAFDKATSRQRGYIHGLSKKLFIDEYADLPYYVNDIRYLTVLQAVRVIDILICMRDDSLNFGIF